MNKYIYFITITSILFSGCSIKTKMADGFNHVNVKNNVPENYVTTFSNQGTNNQLTQMKEAFEKAKQENTVRGYENFIASYPNSYYEAEAKQLAEQKRIANKNNPELKAKILKNVEMYLQKKDPDGLMKYARENPEVMEFARDNPSIYLLFTGPKELQVGKILQYKKKGIKDSVLVSKIKANNQPYKNYSLDEISALVDLGVSDTIMQAMLDVTTAYERENREYKAQQERIEQQRQLQERQAKQVYQQSRQTQTQQQQKSAGDEVMEEVGKEVLKGLINNLF